MEEVNIKDLFDALWTKKYQVIIIIILFLLLGLIYTTIIVKPIFSSSTTLVLASNNNKENENTMTAQDVTINSKLVTTYRNLIKSRTVLTKVIENLQNNTSEEELRKSISVRTVTGTVLIEITVSNEDAQYATDVANEITKVFTEQVQELYNIDNIQLVSEARVPIKPSNINHLKDIVLFTAGGIVLAVLYALVANMFDTTIKSAEEIEKEWSLPVLVSIPLMTNDKKEKKQNEGKQEEKEENKNES